LMQGGAGVLGAPGRAARCGRSEWGRNAAKQGWLGACRSTGLAGLW
jgi:hypothetical protein